MQSGLVGRFGNVVIRDSELCVNNDHQHHNQYHDCRPHHDQHDNFWRSDVVNVEYLNDEYDNQMPAAHDNVNVKYIEHKHQHDQHDDASTVCVSVAELVRQC